MQGHSCDLWVLWLGREGDREDWCGCLVIREADITGGNFQFQLGLSCLLCIQYAVMQLELLVPFLILVFWFSWMSIKANPWFIFFLGNLFYVKWIGLGTFLNLWSFNFGFLSFFFLQYVWHVEKLGKIYYWDSQISMEYS